MIRKLVIDVAVQNRDHSRNVEAKKRSESTEKAGEGPSNPLPVGLPAPSQETPRGTPKETPKGTPKNAQGDLADGVRWPSRSEPLKIVTVEGERVASPPQPIAGPPPLDDDVEMVEEKKVIMEVTESGDEPDLTSMNVLWVDPMLAAKALGEGHKQFWADMALSEFVSLDWGCTKGDVAECREFIKNSDGDATTIASTKIDLSEEGLAKYRHLIFLFFSK
ncbi:unnamed protein product [Calypogeia fissa]